MTEALQETEPPGEPEGNRSRRVLAPGGETQPGVFQKGGGGGQRVPTYFEVSPGGAVCSLVTAGRDTICRWGVTERGGMDGSRCEKGNLQPCAVVGVH